MFYSLFFEKILCKRCPNPLRDNIDNARYAKKVHLFLTIIKLQAMYTNF